MLIIISCMSLCSIFTEVEGDPSLSNQELPDIQILGLTPDWKEGGMFTKDYLVISVALSNEGVVPVYTSWDLVVYSNDKIIINAIINKIINTNSVYWFNYTIKNVEFPPDVILKVEVDTGNKIQELNEDNNYFKISIHGGDPGSNIEIKVIIVSSLPLIIIIVSILIIQRLSKGKTNNDYDME